MDRNTLNKFGRKLIFREAREGIFDIYGFEDPMKYGYVRVNPEAAAAVDEPIVDASRNTAGGRVRFRTDSQSIAIHAAMALFGDMNHFPRSGSSGFDVYVKNGARYEYNSSLLPSRTDYGIEAVTTFPTKREREVMIHFPLYSSVEELYIGLDEGATLEHGAKYTYERPVVYYGSSITQGGCASHPGNSYEAIIGNDLDCNYINLGYSGRAKGEPAMAQFIANIPDINVFVCDYDHNAPEPEHLRQTHYPFYRIVRDAQPELPIIFVTRPNTDAGVDSAHPNMDHIERREAVYSTYRRALDEGDMNVYFIDGDSLFDGDHRDLCTVDGCHPNDIGFLRMASRIGKAVSRCLRK